MKSWIGKGVLAVGIVLVTLTVPTYAQSDDEENDTAGCDNATLFGDYAFTIGGQILVMPAMPSSPGIAFTQAGVSMTHFDGSGHFTQVDFTMINGSPSPGATNANGFRSGATGSYTVNRDCTGSAEIDFPPPPGVILGQRIHLRFVLAEGGKQIHTVVSALFRAGDTTPTPVEIRSDGFRRR